jgi:hypothetical protein
MKLSDLIKTKDIAIPNTDLVVKIKSELSWYEFLEGLKIEDSSQKGINTITKLIVSWNLTDDAGTVLPVTEETVKSLPREIATVIIDEFNKAFDEASKKKAS